MKIKDFIKEFKNNPKFQEKINEQLNIFLKKSQAEREFQSYEGVHYMYNGAIREDLKKIKKTIKDIPQRFKK